MKNEPDNSSKVLMKIDPESKSNVMCSVEHFEKIENWVIEQQLNKEIDSKGGKSSSFSDRTKLKLKLKLLSKQ